MNHSNWFHVISLLISTLPVYYYSMKTKKPQESDQHGFVQTNPMIEQTLTAVTQDYPPHLIQNKLISKTTGIHLYSFSLNP